jgi:signal transduction histidine kinase
VGKRRILCVDDNAALRDNLREILEDAGHEVASAESVAEATRLARDGFDVALVDVRLPDGDGISLATKLREIVPDAQVIMLTGFATLESAIATVRAGAWAYLMKPCKPNDLLLAVDQALKQRVLIEEKKELQRRALVAEKLAAIGTMTAGLSHEIKNPLNAATLQLNVLERRVRRLPPEMQPTLTEPLRLVQEEVTRLNSVLEDFLAFARPRELRQAPIDVTAMLSHVVDLLAPQADKAGVQLDRDWKDDGLRVVGDDVRLQQAVMNLVLNAIQATPDGGHVHIEAGQTGDMVRVTVEDTGPGIPDDIRQRIFEPFFTTKAGGSGLGLPLVHSIIEQHGGSIAIEHGDLGGARFAIRLPMEIAR